MELSKEARKERKLYMREWRAKPENKEKTRQYNKRYWEKLALQRKESIS